MPIAQTMDQRVDDLRKLIPSALRDFEEEPIHKARVTTRRLAAALHLLEPVVSNDLYRKFDRIMKKLRRRLGPLRDLDVILSQLEAHHAPADAIAWLHERLEAERARARKAAGEKSINKPLSNLGVWWALHGQVEDAAPAVDSLLSASIQQQLNAFHERATQEPIADPHLLRISGKKLRYTLELAADHGHPLPKDVLKSFEKLQEALGQWHDLVVFSETIVRASLDAELALHSPAIAEGILDLSKQTLRRSTRSLQKFVELWKTGGDAIADKIRATFDLPTEPKTDPGPSPTDGSPPQELPSADGPAAGPG
jgi:CHAD domain-containing protein